MFSRLYNLFTQDNRDENYFKLGGPRSFHKFTYKNTTIILIGEVHEKMKSELAKKYTGIFNQFIVNRHTKLFLEISKDNTNKVSSDDISFIDCMKNLTHSSCLEIVYSDKRHYDEDFGTFFFFLNKLAEVENTVIATYKEKNMDPPSPIPFFNENVDFLNWINMISDLYNNNYMSSDLLELLESQVKILDQLYDKYSKLNIKLGNYIAECVVKRN